MSNPYEQSGRLEKAGALLVTLLGVKVSHAEAIKMDESHWALAAKASGVNMPSEETRATVLKALHDLKRYERKP